MVHSPRPLDSSTALSTCPLQTPELHLKLGIPGSWPPPQGSHPVRRQSTDHAWDEVDDDHANDAAPDGANEQRRNEDSGRHHEAVRPRGEQMIHDEEHDQRKELVLV